jgi:hypothetical protein
MLRFPFFRRIGSQDATMILPRLSIPVYYTAAAFLLGALAAPLSAQSIVRGSVVDDGSGVPINAVDIRLIDADGETRAQTISNEQGHFRMEVVDSDTYSLSVRRVGYAPIMAEGIEVEEESELELEVRLSARAVALQPVTVVAQRRAEPIRITEFRERAELSRRMGRGRVYMRDDLDRLNPNSAQEVLDGVLWGARCRPLVLLDGLPTDGRIFGLSGDQLEGIEIYRGVNQIPPEYYRYGMCGLALVWSRVDPEGMRPLTWARVAVAGVIVAVIGLLSR